MVLILVKEKNVLEIKIPIYLLATPSTHIPYRGYSKHECVKTVLCVSNAFERVKTFCWLLALNTSFHKKHCFNLIIAGKFIFT